MAAVDSVVMQWEGRILKEGTMADKPGKQGYLKSVPRSTFR